jgi:Fe-S cluster assembly protein SufD
VVVSGDGDVEPPASVTAALEAETALVRIVDGEVVDATIPSALADKGLIVTDLVTAANDHAEVVQAALGSLTTSDPDGTGGDEDRTITVNDAAWTAGVFVHVPAELELTDPIGIHVHVTQPGAHLPRVLLVVERHAKATFYLEHTSVDGVDALVDEVVEVVAGDGSDVQVATLQSWSKQVQHLALQKVQAHRDANVRTLSVTTGGATVRFRPETDLVGPGSQTRPLGVYFADEGQWFDLQPYVRHIAPHASSDVLFKGALQGKSQTVFRGNVFVHRDAVGTATDENNKSLILTEGAHADSTPFLEIECADITAGHGSATGQIDARHLFYLESRGIPREEALRLIVFGFFREVLTELDLPGLEQAALAAIESRIEAADLSAFQVNDAMLKDEASKADR